MQKSPLDFSNAVMSMIKLLQTRAGSASHPDEAELPIRFWQVFHSYFCPWTLHISLQEDTLRIFHSTLFSNIFIGKTVIVVDDLWYPANLLQIKVGEGVQKNLCSKTVRYSFHPETSSDTPLCMYWKSFTINICSTLVHITANTPGCMMSLEYWQRDIPVGPQLIGHL